MFSKFCKFGLPVIAAGFAVFALIHALRNQRQDPPSPPPVQPPSSPFGNTVAGVGMVEPSGGASGTSVIAIGSQLAGVVDKVHVKIGQEVKAGDLLFELDKRQMDAQFKVSQAGVAAAAAQLRRLDLQPRREELPVSEAQVEAAVATAKQQLDQVERDRNIPVGGGLSEADRVSHQQAYLNAKSLLSVAQASLALLKAGAWEPDKAISKANLDQAQAQLEQAQTNLKLLQVRASSDGTILQLNIRPGEYVSTNSSQSLILMGNLHPVHVRVNVDEEDLPRLIMQAPAIAKIRGDLQQKEISLRFVRLEPYVVPKVSLTGVNVERVDTRVVQLIYAVELDPPALKESRILIGQIVDVFIDTSTNDAAAAKSP